MQISADAALAQVLDRYVRERIERAPTEDDFATLVRSTIRRAVGSGDLGAEHAARSLGVSTRTLHRRLREQRTTYQRLLNDVRRDAALVHLEEGRLSLGEIAFVLGYSEPSAFHRAFKRWTGETAASYRRDARG